MVHAGFDVLDRQVLTVVKLDTFAEFEVDRHVVDDIPRFGQGRHDLAVPVAIDQ